MGSEDWPVSDALDELVVEAYLQIFVTRLPSLKQSLKTKANIEGLVYRNINQLVHDAQKRHDPLGYRVFQWLRDACEALRSSGQISTLGRVRKICNGTVLTFGAGQAMCPKDLDLADQVSAWNHELMPAWFMAGGQQTANLVDALAAKILELRDTGIEAFEFRQIIEPWKDDLRARWLMLWFASEEDSSTGHTPLTMPHDWAFEGRDRFDKLARRVEQRLTEHPCQQRTRAHLSRLWSFLLLHAKSDEGSQAVKADLVDAVDSEQLPSNRELSRLLSIPRDRFPDLFETLRSVVAQALAEIDLQPPEGVIDRGICAQ